MSVPYGAWLGSIEQDAFYPPHELGVEIQSFLADHEHLCSRETWHDVGVIYSVESNFQRLARPDQIANTTQNVSSRDEIPFWQVSDALCDAKQPYEVIFFPDGVLRPDALTAADLARYRTLILPDCHALTLAQAHLLEEFVVAGKGLLVLGELGANLPSTVIRPILEHARTHRLDAARPFVIDDLPDGLQVRLTPDNDLALTVQRVGNGAALHLIRYDFDQEQDRVSPLPELTIDLRLPGRFGALSISSPDGAMTGDLETDGPMHRIRLCNVPLYSVVLLEPA